MVTTITEDLLTSKVNRPRTKCAVRKAIIIHYTGNSNKGANAKKNRDYFNNTSTYASTHFLVDDKQIIQAVPIWEAAWSVGAKSYMPIGKKMFHNGKEPNYTTVSIEMCNNSDADHNLVVENTVWLTVHLMKQLNLTVNDIYRHYDITGKNCPAFYVKDKDWQNFLSKVRDAWNDTKRGEKIVLDTIVLKTVKTITNDLNVRKGPDGAYEVVKKLPLGTTVKVYETLKGWYRIDGGWINADSKYTKDVAVSVDDDEHTINSSPTIDLTYAKGRVKVSGTLNIRKGILGVDRDTSIVGSYTNGQIVDLIQERGNWYKTKDGWVSGQYIERIDERYSAVLTKDANIRDNNLKVLCTGKTGEECIVYPGSLTVDGVKIIPVRYKDTKGYVQEGSFKLK